jgi:hypothetical protein
MSLISFPQSDASPRGNGDFYASLRNRISCNILIKRLMSMDSKSRAGDSVPVRFRLSAPTNMRLSVMRAVLLYFRNSESFPQNAVSRRILFGN